MGPGGLGERVGAAHPHLQIPGHHGVREFLPAPGAFLRVTEEETLLCVANLAATARRAQLTIPGYEGTQSVDVFGGAVLGAVADDGAVTFTLGSRDFFWSVLTPTSAPASEPAPTTADAHPA